MKKQSLQQLYVDELKDLYSAEVQLVKALPKMAKGASNDQLRQAIEEHLRQTSNQVSRLEQIFEQIGEKPTGKKCLGMEGLLKEGAEVMREGYSESVTDAAIIGAAQRVEHYEMAGYGTAKSHAQLLGEEDQVALLEETLNEEKEADEKLTELSETVNAEAQESGEQENGRQQGGRQETGRKNGDSRESGESREGKSKSRRAA